MERNRSKKVKSLRAAGKKIPSDNQMEHQLSLRGPLYPPAMSLVKKEVQWRRFQQNATVTNVAFTLANGHDQFLVVTNVAGNAVPYVDSWRIKKIRIWALSAEDTTTSVVLTPTGASSDNMRNDRESIFEISSRSSADPAYMEITCSKSQPLGSWHFTSNTGFASSLFQVNIQQNLGTLKNTRVTIDMCFETITNYAGLPLGYGVVTGTTTLGVVGGRNILGGFQLLGINNLG